jgi:hypothetical protein
VFIHSGQTVQAKAPLGNFRLKYAMGTTWYGEQYLFGPDTNYHKAERILGFSQTAAGYSGHIIQLIRQTSGNLINRFFENDNSPSNWSNTGSQVSRVVDWAYNSLCPAIVAIAVIGGAMRPVCSSWRPPWNTGDSATPVSPSLESASVA